jgi:hypothetical protein
MFNVNFANRHRASRWAWLGLAARPPLRSFTFWDLPFARNGAVVHCALRTNPMNVVLIAIGCVLMALGLVMLANRSGYVYFVVGPRSVLVVAGVVAMLAFWILRVAK